MADGARSGAPLGANCSADGGRTRLTLGRTAFLAIGAGALAAAATFLAAARLTTFFALRGGDFLAFVFLAFFDFFVFLTERFAFVGFVENSPATAFSKASMRAINLFSFLAMDALRFSPKR
jgi:hypothetical protein